MTEPYAKAQPELVQRMIDEGHEIGNHSVTHPSEGLPSQSLEQQKMKSWRTISILRIILAMICTCSGSRRVNSVTGP